jgi:aminobenzoyl-glutamate utilization protein B
MPTAFVASFGSGKPVLGVLGEFDALPGMSQAAEPRMGPATDAPGAPQAGHACGHNLFGTGSLAAVVAVKDWMRAHHASGTLRYYGTPAEEGGGGKLYMVHAGLFDDVDAVLAWHPADRNDPSDPTSLAALAADFTFHGIAAHASVAPDKGRSALDGVEAFDAMVNLMREHIPSDARIHYVITNGGKAPNIVPDTAAVSYIVRHPKLEVLDELWPRVLKAAEGAALGTGTTMDWKLVSFYYPVIGNRALTELQVRTCSAWVACTTAPRSARSPRSSRRPCRPAGSRSARRRASRRPMRSRGAARATSATCRGSSRRPSSSPRRGCPARRRTPGRRSPRRAHRSARRACWSLRRPSR